MINKERIIKTIFKAVDEVNELSPKERRIEKTPKTVLLGRDGVLDSLGVIALIVAVEQKIEEEFEIAIMLADEKISSQENNPLQTVETLVGHISMLLEEKLNGQTNI